MADISTPSVDRAQLLGGKRKNGHSMTCSCVICTNMKNKAMRKGYSEDLENRRTPSNKANGHKLHCKRRRGGTAPAIAPATVTVPATVSAPATVTVPATVSAPATVPAPASVPASQPAATGGKRSNGHKATCSCPICRNMRKHAGMHRSSATKTTLFHRKGKRSGRKSSRKSGRRTRRRTRHH